MKPQLRYVLVLVLLVLQGVTLFAILFSSRNNMEALLRDHAREVMSHLVSTVVDNSREFLAPAERALDLSERLLSKSVLSTIGPTELEGYFLDQLRSNPELAGIYLGQPDGSFFYVKREDNGFLTKDIVATPTRSVTYAYRDANLKGWRRAAEDAYDPRERPWYGEALAKNTKVWTKPYVFFTSGRPGITVAQPVYSQPKGELLGVLGIDVEIAGLSKFLQDVPMSNNGRAFIMNQEGEVIAFPDLERALAQGFNVLQVQPKPPEPSESPQQSEVQDSPPETNVALPPVTSLGRGIQNFLLQVGKENLTLEQRDFVEFKIEGKPFYGSLSPLRIDDNNQWLVGVYAPSSDFSGILVAQNRQHVWQLLSIGLLSCLLAIPLVFGVTRPLKALYERATRDPLTELPNRTEFIRRAELIAARSRRSGQGVALAMLDLDGFKGVNDRYGHTAGDMVLEVVAKRMASSVRSGDLVGRYGGDEFAILLVDVDEKGAKQLIDRLRVTIGQEPVRADKNNYRVGASAGVAMLQLHEDVVATLARADEALLIAKAQGKDKTLTVGEQQPFSVKN
ncbi:MAG: sensor domain-containing diguanylate cyclase [Trueperaceae bacterium]